MNLFYVAKLELHRKRTIIVEWQQLASHGRREHGQDYADPMCSIDEISDGRSWVQHTFFKVDEAWKISEIKPEVIYHTGDFLQVGREDKVWHLDYAQEK